jgi:selenocysteine lyase/cysteine desulfurase
MPFAMTEASRAMNEKDARPGPAKQDARPWDGEFQRFRQATGDLLHFAAHSHHFWPDVTFDAHLAAWTDAARWVDEKWAHVLGEVLPTAQGHVARLLGLKGGDSIAFAPNTHEFLTRLGSCFPHRPVSILTTDSEFHSFNRQGARWQEAGDATLEIIATEPFETFEERFLEAAAARQYDWVFLSQVFFNSGFVFENFAALADALPPETYLVIDGYHAFMALPTDFSALQDRAFYLAGGYKYAMAGEGACFLHCPPGYGLRPAQTGWMAEFESLEDQRQAGTVGYAQDGMRFFGSTFDPSGLYRFNASLGRWHDLGVSVAMIHAHVARLQGRFLDTVARGQAGTLRLDDLLPPPSFTRRGHFLTFRRPDAGDLHDRLRARGVITDVRGDRLRFGFGLYLRDEDVDELAVRLP